MYDLQALGFFTYGVSPSVIHLQNSAASFHCACRNNVEHGGSEVVLKILSCEASLPKCFTKQNRNLKWIQINGNQ